MDAMTGQQQDRAELRELINILRTRRWLNGAGDRLLRHLSNPAPKGDTDG